MAVVSHKIPHETARDSFLQHLQFPYWDPIQCPSCLGRIQIDPTFNGNDTAVYGTARPSTHKDSPTAIRIIYDLENQCPSRTTPERPLVHGTGESGIPPRSPEEHV